jgi:hypothetical protein
VRLPLVAIAKRGNALVGILHKVLQVVSIAALEKAPLPELVARVDTTNVGCDTGNGWEIGRDPTTVGHALDRFRPGSTPVRSSVT